MADAIHIKIHTPEGVYLETDCASISSRNILGEFNILPFHTNYISNINDNTLIESLDGKKSEIPVQMGVVRVSDNHMEVFLVLSPILKSTDR
jgi:F0F1-type ATP synthase epsilon subunit